MKSTLSSAFLRKPRKFVQSSLWFWRLLSKFQNHKGDCAHFCGLYRTVFCFTAPMWAGVLASFFPPSCLLLQRAYLNAYYFASFVEILHRLRDTSQTLGGVRPRGNGRLPLQRLAPSHFATFWEFHYAPHRAQHTLANDEGTYLLELTLRYVKLCKEWCTTYILHTT